jgi:hypothetical protein
VDTGVWVQINNHGDDRCLVSAMFSIRAWRKLHGDSTRHYLLKVIGWRWENGRTWRLPEKILHNGAYAALTEPADRRRNTRSRNPALSTEGVKESGSHPTLRWRKKDSNPRSPVRDYAFRDAPLIIPAIRSRGKNRFLCERDRRLKIPRGRVGLSSEFRGCRRGKDLPENAARGWRPRRIPIFGQNGHAAAAPSC